MKSSIHKCSYRGLLSYIFFSMQDIDTKLGIESRGDKTKPDQICYGEGEVGGVAGGSHVG
jgi:hypothetical protein